MKNKFFKIMLLSVVAILSACCLFACADDGSSTTKKGLFMKKMSGNDTYTVYDYVDDGTLTDGVLDIAAVAGEGKVVSRIKTNAFYGADNIKKLIVPSTVTQIDEGAFANMKNLEELVIPFVGYNANSDTYYGESATAADKSVDKMRTFGYMFGTEKYHFAQKATQVYDGNDSSFDYYVPITLRKVTVMPANDYGIPMYAFYGNTAINTVVLGDKVNAIGDYSFANVMYLSDLVVTANVTRIGKGAFKDCCKLNTGLDLSNATALLTIGDNAFENAGIKNITIPSNVTSIGQRAFKGSKIKTLNLGNVTDISAYLCYDCESLSKVTANSVISIGTFAFYGCKSLSSFNSNDENTVNLDGITYIGGSSFTKIKKTGELFNVLNQGILNLSDSGLI